MKKQVSSFSLSPENIEYIDAQWEEKGKRNRSHWLDDLITHLRVTSEAKKPQVRSKQFKPPTMDEAADYFLQRGCMVESEVEKFLDFYEMKGWMVGKNKMKDWKAAVRNWLKGKVNEATKQGITKSGRKPNAVEEANNRLLEKYGDTTAQYEREVNQPINTGLDQHQVCGGIPAQMDSSGITIDMDSGDISDDGGADKDFSF